ncbi:MAG TPA: ACP S-malonyltransferase [Acidimicrobiales bacterium]
MSPPDHVVAAFPGQGSLTPEVGAPWEDHPSFSAVTTISDTVGIDLAHLLVEGAEAELVSTRNAQLATFALSLAILDASKLADRAEWMLGHSLGEYTALVAAGVVSRVDGARLVDARGTAMLEAATAEPGGLVALIGGDADAADAACAAIPTLAVANRNGPGQIVLGGTTAALDTLAEQAKSFGFRRAIPLRVGGAFHTPLMAPAAPALETALASTTFRAGTAHVVANVDGEAHDNPSDWPALLVRQLTEPVDFERGIRALPSGAMLVEFGPGGVLCGLAKRIRDDLSYLPIGTPDDLDALETFR